MLEGEVFCADCGKDLYEFDPGYPAVEPHIAYKSLQISLYGGYGLFFDTDFQTVPEYYDLWLCHDCAHKLVERTYRGGVMSYDFGIPFDSVGAAMRRFAHKQEEVTIQPIEYIKWDQQYEFADFDLEVKSGPELLGVSTKPEFDYGEAL